MSTKSVGKINKSVVSKTPSRNSTARISTYNRFKPLGLADTVENEMRNENSTDNVSNITGLEVNSNHKLNNCKYNSKTYSVETTGNKNPNSKTGCASKTKIKTETKRKTKLSCMYFNARSIVNKIEELEVYTKEENLDIIAVTETWLTDEILTSEFSVEGYTLLRKDRKDLVKTRGGGVAIYVKDEINVTERDDLSVQLFPESVWCELEFKGEKTLLGVCYRPPDSLTVNNEAMYSLINKVGRENVVIMGDFNFPELSWGHKSSTLHEHPFITCINENFLEQMVDKPTRGENILDLVLCSDISFVQNLKVGEPFATSDHQIIRFDLMVSKEVTKENAITYSYFKADYGKIREYASERHWEDLVDNSDVDKSWLAIKSELLDIRNKFVPKLKQNKNKCKWVNREVVTCRRAKKKAWNRYVNSGKKVEMYQQYVIRRRQCAAVNKKAKEDFETKLADNIKQDSKSFYAYIRSKQRCKDKIGPLKDSTGNVLTDDKFTADLLNKYFVGVFTKEDLANIPEPVKIFTGSSSSEGLNIIEISEELVYNKLAEINVNKCIGVDELHPKLLYELRGELVKPLCALFKLSLETASLPQDWRDANVTPLFKKGSKNMAENYRPISLTSKIGKILESIIKDQIVSHLEKFKLILDSQHGFRKGRSCLTNLLNFLEVVTCYLDDGQPVDLIYLDFAKAFDKVPFVRLFKKLESHGISGQVLEWVKQWLNNRRQRVSVNKTFSEWGEVSSGVPQGSVLGPVLFLIYINDIDVGLLSKLSKFADDSKLCKNICLDSDREILQLDLDKLNDWSQKWQMQFNVDKCSVIHLGQKNKQYKYKLGDSELKQSVKERDLGIIVDSSMKWSEQCSVAVKNANSTLGIIRRHIKSRKKNIIVKLYKTLVRPKLEYCVQAWCPYLKKDIDNIERVQHRATKLIGEYAGLSYNNRLDRVGLITLEKRRLRGDLIQVFKLIKGIDKIDYNTFFQVIVNSRTRGHRFKIVKVRARLDIRNKFFSQRVVNSWNVLPAHVVEAETVNAFKNRLDKFWAVSRDGN
jgi:hypothetical protein